MSFKRLIILKPNVAVEWLAFLPRVYEVSVLRSGTQIEVFPGFCQSLQADPGIYMKLIHDRFLIHRICRRKLIGRSEGKRPPGGPRLRWEVAITFILEKEGVDWIHLTEDGDQ